MGAAVRVEIQRPESDQGGAEGIQGGERDGAGGREERHGGVYDEQYFGDGVEEREEVCQWDGGAGLGAGRDIDGSRERECGAMRGRDRVGRAGMHRVPRSGLLHRRLDDHC